MSTNSAAKLASREKIVYGVLFLLPIAGITVRHWISTSFTVLAVLSLPNLFKERDELKREERVFLWICVAFFAVFLISALINGWTDLQTRYLEREIRVLLIIPIYLMLRSCPDAGKWILRGGAIGALVILAYSVFDVYVLHKPQAEGAYSPNLLGPFAVLLTFWLVTAWRFENEKPAIRILMLVASVAAVLSVALSGSRGAYLGLIVVAATWLAMNFRGRRLALAGLAAAGLIFAVFTMSDTVADRTRLALSELKEYVQVDDVALLEGRFHAGEGRLGAVSARIEMWRVSALFFNDNPIWGVGRGNYVNEVGKYVDQGLVHAEVAKHSHPHNAFLEMVISKGLSGLVIFMALLFYPLIYFVRTFKLCRETAMLGIIHIVGFAVFSLTDASTFIKGNYLSIFLLFLATFFAWHVRNVRERDT